MSRPVENLFAGIPVLDTGEDFRSVYACPALTIERIVSSPRPEPTLYDQDGDEWVLLLQGDATLELDGEPVRLTAGDHLLIPAHLPHRVLATSEAPRCIWLAVHIHSHRGSKPTASAAAP